MKYLYIALFGMSVCLANEAKAQDVIGAIAEVKSESILVALFEEQFISNGSLVEILWETPDGDLVSVRRGSVIGIEGSK